MAAVAGVALVAAEPAVAAVMVEAVEAVQAVAVVMVEAVAVELLVGTAAGTVLPVHKSQFPIRARLCRRSRPARRPTSKCFINWLTAQAGS